MLCTEGYLHERNYFEMKFKTMTSMAFDSVANQTQTFEFE